MRHFEIKRGEWPSNAGAPAQRINGQIAVGSAAFLGRDMPGLRPVFEVKQGEQVEIGQTLFTDRKHPEIAFVSPVTGRVSTLAYGARKTLSACILEVDDTVQADPASVPIEAASAASIRETLLARGMWIAFRTRPFGKTPTPDAKPTAIFVNACHASPLAADPRLVLEDRMATFRHGVSLLTRLTEGKVYVCQSPGDAFCAEEEQIEPVSFSGTIAAGLAGTHVDRLCRISATEKVWTISYQDVIAIGHLFETGQYLAERVVSVAGVGAARPRLVRTCLGANIADICDAGEGSRALAGDPYTGHAATYLGRFHAQISVNAKTTPKPIRTWTLRKHTGLSALVPTGALDHALAPDILAVPLLRALSIGDSETAERLGCLGLIEEDVATLSRRCTSGTNYGALLRLVLDDLMEAAA